VQLSSENETSIRLNTIGELKYTGNNSFELTTSDAWINSGDNPLEIAMKYANITLEANSVASLTQNEV